MTILKLLQKKLRLLCSTCLHNQNSSDLLEIVEFRNFFHFVLDTKETTNMGQLAK